MQGLLPFSFSQQKNKILSNALLSTFKFHTTKMSKYNKKFAITVPSSLGFFFFFPKQSMYFITVLSCMK